MPHFRVTIAIERTVEAPSIEHAGVVALNAIGKVKRPRVVKVEQVEAQVLEITPVGHGQAADKVGAGKEG